MMTTTVTSKGQVTIPKPIRDNLGIEPGMKVEFCVGKNGDVVLKKVGTDTIAERLASMVGHAGPGLSTDEIMLMTRGNLDDDTY